MLPLSSHARIAGITGLRKEDPNNILISYDIGGTHYEMAELYLLLNDYPSALAAAEKLKPTAARSWRKIRHTRSQCVSQRRRNSWPATSMRRSGRDNQMDSWRKALENYGASREIYNALKADGKIVAMDEKRLAAVEAAISVAESKLLEVVSKVDSTL